MTPTAITVAWIGNSLTDFNNLPSMFQNLSLHLPQPVDVQYQAVMPGGAALFDHANLSLPVGVETADMLSGGPWDYVVLQDQSQTPGGGRNEDDGLWTLGEAKARSERAIVDFYAPRIDAAAVLYATWGHHSGDANNSDIYPDFPTMTKRTASGYAEYAALLQKHSVGRAAPMIVPAGEAFQYYWNVSGATPPAPGTRFSCLFDHPADAKACAPRSYYDHMHPSLLGTYLTAALFAATIHAQPLDQVKWAPEGISADDREFALAVASKMVARETRVQ